MSSISRRIGRTNLVNSLRSKKAVAALAMLASAVGLTARASTLTWDANGATAGVTDGAGTWNTTTSEFWNGTSDAPWVNANNDTAVFGNVNGAAGTVTVSNTITTGGLTFNTAGSGTYTITGGTLNFAGTPVITNNANGTTISSAITLTNDTTVNVTQSTINGNTTSYSMTISGVIGGTAQLTKTGPAFLTVTGANTFTGGLVENGGSFAIGNYGTTSTSSPIGRGTMSITGSTTGGISFNVNNTAAGLISTNNAFVFGNNNDALANSFKFFTSGNLGYLNLGTGPVTFSTFAGDTGDGPAFAPANSGVLIIGGNIGESTPGQTLTKYIVPTQPGNGGFLVLTGNNSFTGAVNVNGGFLVFSRLTSLGLGTAINFGSAGTAGGILQYGAGNTADISSRTVSISGTAATIDTNGNNVIYANGIGNGGNGALTKAGAGTLTLLGTNNYTGATTVNRGTLALGPSAALGSTTLNMGSATFSIDPASLGQTFNNTNLSGAAQVSAAFTGGGTLALGAITHNVGSAINISLPTGSGLITTSTSNSDNNGVPTILSGWATVNRTDWATNNGTNVAAFTGYMNNNFTMPQDFGTPFNDVDVTGASVTPGSTSVNSLRFNDAGGTTVSDSAGDTLNVIGGGILVTPNSGGVTFSQATLNANGAPSNELTIHQYSTNPVVINSQINGGPLTKVGPGTIVLANPNGNSFANLVVDGGTVSFAQDNQLGSGSNQVTLNGGTISYTGIGNLTTGRTITAGPAGATINIVNPGTNGGGAKMSFTATNPMQGTGSITLNGNGILTLGANQTYNGAGYIVNGGVLESKTNASQSVTTTDSLGVYSVPVTVNAGGEFTVGANTPNPVIANGGIIGNEASAVGILGAVAVNSNSFYRLGQFFSTTNVNGQITGSISGSGNLTIINAPAVTPSAANPNPASGNPGIVFVNQLINQLFILSGNNSQYTGTMNFSYGHDIRFQNPNSIPTNWMIKSTPQYAGIATTVFNTNLALNLDPTGVQDGGVGPATGFTASQNYNLATINAGNDYYTTDTGSATDTGGTTPANTGVSSFGNILPGNSGIIRIAGGGTGSLTASGLFIGNANNLNDASGQHTPVVIGDTRVGLTGTVRYGQRMGYTGTTTVNASSNLVLDFSIAGIPVTNLVNPASQLILAGGNFATIGRASVTTAQTFAGLVLNPGQSSIVANNNATSNPMNVNLGAITRNAGGTVDFTNPANGTLSATNGITTSSTNTLFPGGAAASILGGYATVKGADWAVVNPDTTISALTNYAGDFSTPGTDVNVPGGSTVLAGDTVVNSLKFANGGTDLDPQTPTPNTHKLTVASGGILETSAAGNNFVAIDSLTITSGNGQDLIIIQNNPSNTFFLNASLVDNGGPIGLTKSGSGGVQLDSANTFTGDTNVNNGTLAVANSLALQNSTLNYNIINGSNILLTNGITSFVVGGLKGNGNLNSTNNVGAGIAVNIGGNNSSTTYSGVISGLGSLTKSGTGTLAIGNDETYSGGTTVAAGTLQLGNGQPFGSVVGNISNGSVVAFGRSDTYTMAGVISGTGSVVQNGPGTTVLAANNSYQGGTTINGGTLSVATDAKLGQSGTQVFLNGGTLATTSPFTLFRTLNITANSTISAGADLNLLNDLITPSNLTKSGAGKLSAPSFNVGALNVAAGSLAVNPNGLLNKVSSLTVGDNTAATTAQLDLNNNDLVVSYTTTSPAATIGQLLKAGYSGGAWNGNGIDSSAAQAHPGQALGYGDAADLGITNIDNVTLTGSNIIVKYTYSGDASLDGKVDLGNDLNLFLAGYLTPGATGWDQGDFNYDGTVDNADFGLLIDGLKTQGTPLGELDAAIEASPLLSAAQKSSLLSVVPEPSTMAVLALAGAGLMTRRRRK